MTPKALPLVIQAVFRPQSLGSLMVAFAVLAGACRPAKNEARPPPAGLQLPWRLDNKGSLIVAEQLGGARVYVSAGAPSRTDGLPGLVEGGSRGPAYGLLGGYFAPRILARGPSERPKVTLQTTAFDVRLPGLRALVSRADRGIRYEVRGGATFAFSADRTDVQGQFRGQPSFAVKVSAGAAPGLRPLRGDRLFIRSRRGDAFELTTSCPRIVLIHPVPRGSTSVFLIHVGPAPLPTEDLYMPSNTLDPSVVDELTGCATTESSTLTAPMP